MAFTSGLLNSGTVDAAHAIELQASGQVRSLQLYDRPGDDTLPNKGDLWTFSIASFGIPDSCITISDIRGVSIIESSDDGWNIESIVTIVESSGRYQLLTRDFGANHWVDGDGPNSRRRFDLTLACTQQ